MADKEDKRKNEGVTPEEKVDGPVAGHEEGSTAVAGKAAGANGIHWNSILIGILIGSGVAVVLLGAFGLGVKVGASKAAFSKHIGSGHNGLSERGSVGRGHDRGSGGKMGQRGRGGLKGKGGSGRFDGRKRGGGKQRFSGGHGVAGEITDVSGDVVLIEDRAGNEKTVKISERTKVLKGGSVIDSGDIDTGDPVVVLGEPNDAGEIDAKLIKILAARGKGTLAPPGGPFGSDHPPVPGGPKAPMQIG